MQNKLAAGYKQILMGVLFCSATAIAQFSPGDLTNAHKQLEGSQNCTRCHELGKEIGGAKCLGCHEEIKMLIDMKHGLHGAGTLQECVKCHQEHLGRNAKTVLFDEKNFDHTRTGFVLTGKHAGIQCEQCHTAKNIKEAMIQKKLAEYRHKSFLGLDSGCVSCHTDPHRGQFKQECTTCHNTSSWSQVRNFDHSKAKFPLEGKHTSAACSKCHVSLLKEEANGPIDFKTRSFSDCSPCHLSPHVSKFNGRACTTCHNAQEWSKTIGGTFEHNLTRFKLTGKHATLRCEKCHLTIEGGNFSKVFLISYNRCIDCHTDKHNGEFLRSYSNNCASCHTEYGYRPSTFTLERHNQSRFKLTGAHAATVCGECHRKSGFQIFHFENIRCESCHKDTHRGEFIALMKELSCEKCHSTGQWKSAAFDHSKTKFPLAGKHAGIICSDCHKEVKKEKMQQEFRKLSTECRSCHKNVHGEQFNIDGEAVCNECHNTGGWKLTGFDHETKSRFSLKGAHKNLTCKACHREEKNNDIAFIRFKPLSVKCESCHGERDVK